MIKFSQKTWHVVFSQAVKEVKSDYFALKTYDDQTLFLCSVKLLVQEKIVGVLIIDNMFFKYKMKLITHTLITCLVDDIF